MRRKPIIQLNSLEKTVVHTLAQEEYDTLMQIYECGGWKWRGGVVPTNLDKWSEVKRCSPDYRELCIMACPMDPKETKTFGFSHKKHFSESNYKIVSVQEFYGIQKITHEKIEEISNYFKKAKPNRKSKIKDKIKINIKIAKRYRDDPLTALVNKNLPRGNSLMWLQSGSRGIIIPTVDVPEEKLSELHKGYSYVDWNDGYTGGRAGLEISFGPFVKHEHIYHSLASGEDTNPLILKCDSEGRFVNKPLICEVRNGYGLRFERGFRNFFDTARKRHWEPEDTREIRITMWLDNSLRLEKYPKSYPEWIFYNPLINKNFYGLNDKDYKRSYKIVEQNLELYTPEVRKLISSRNYRDRRNFRKNNPKMTPKLFQDLLRFYRDYSVEGFELTPEELRKLQD